jgi:hypothetical protein
MQRLVLLVLLQLLLRLLPRLLLHMVLATMRVLLLLPLPLLLLRPTIRGVKRALASAARRCCRWRCPAVLLARSSTTSSMSISI